MLPAYIEAVNLLRARASADSFLRCHVYGFRFQARGGVVVRPRERDRRQQVPRCAKTRLRDMAAQCRGGGILWDKMMASIAAR